MTSIQSLMDESYPISATMVLSLGCTACGPKDWQNITGADYLRLAGTETIFICTTLFGVIETIFWASLALLAKAVHVFISQSETVDKIFAQLFSSALLTLSSTTFAAAMVGKNFFIDPADVESEVYDPINEMYHDEGKKYYTDFINYKFFK